MRLITRTLVITLSMVGPAAMMGCGWGVSASLLDAGAPPAVVQHPGMLSTSVDLNRIRSKVSHNAAPWIVDWQELQQNSHDSVTYKERPVAVVVRGATAANPTENYPQLYNDAAAAYALALDWNISNDTRKADKAAEILDAWASTLTTITGTSDKYLAAGIYGYQLANAAELLRGYSGWPAASLQRFQRMMLTVFYPMNHDFLLNHNGAKIDHYWANWDLCNIASMMAIGILADDRDKYHEAVDYFLHGKGNGALPQLVWKLYGDDLGQWQESGRDQGHTILGVGLAGVIAQMAWNQGDDLFGADNNRLLKGFEYVAKYNLGNDVPYTSYTNSDVTQSTIAPASRGELRPVWELLYNHYVVLKKLNAPWVQQFAAQVRPEGGGGDYGTTSGGFDHIGYGTLLYSLP